MITRTSGFLGSGMHIIPAPEPTYTELCEQANELARIACYALNEGDIENAKVWALKFEAMTDRAVALLKNSRVF